MAGRRVLAVSGLADPSGFYAMLHEIETDLVGVLEYPDHHVYKSADWQTIVKAAADADIVLTTEKDLVKLEKFPFPRDSLYAFGLKWSMSADDAARLDEIDHRRAVTQARRRIAAANFGKPTEDFRMAYQPGIARYSRLPEMQGCAATDRKAGRPGLPCLQAGVSDPRGHSGDADRGGQADYVSRLTGSAMRRSTPSGAPARVACGRCLYQSGLGIAATLRKQGDFNVYYRAGTSRAAGATRSIASMNRANFSMRQFSRSCSRPSPRCRYAPRSSHCS